MTYSKGLINDNHTINYYYQTSNYIKYIPCNRYQTYKRVIAFFQILLNAVRQIEHKCKNLTKLMNPIFVPGTRTCPSYTKLT